MNLIVLTIVFSYANFSELQAQRKDKGVMIEYKNPFWEDIKKGVEEFEKKEAPKRKEFKMDFSELDIPKSKDEFEQVWHNEPISQGWTGTCWSYSAISMLESDIFRIHKKKLKLSEMYIVYWEYVEKARRFVREKGDSFLGEGSQANAVIERIEQYGIVPLSAYTGLKDGQQHHSHRKLFQEFNDYLQFVKNNKFWNEPIVIETVKNILNSHIGEPPNSFSFEGKTYTPKEFASNVARINTKDYIDVLSLLQHGYWTMAIHDVPDNWWRSNAYHNVPLDEFVLAIRNAIQNGFSLFIGGDVSETGHYSFADAAMVPSYDIPSEYIDDHAKQFRYSNGTTGDDHGIHIVGLKKHNNEFWYLIKDSGSGAMNGNNKGYYFYHEDYIKLKMMNFMCHKDAINDLLTKFQRNKK